MMNEGVTYYLRHVAEELLRHSSDDARASDK